MTKDEKWKALAHGVGEILVGEKSPVWIRQTRASRWNIAFDRTKPEVITAPAGYFPGAAGIAAQLLLLYCFETETDRITGLIDDPYRKSGQPAPRRAPCVRVNPPRAAPACRPTRCR
ncbi:MAG: hypothetical protein ACI4OI_07690 [Gemmiger sp.]